MKKANSPVVLINRHEGPGAYVVAITNGSPNFMDAFLMVTMELEQEGAWINAGYYMAAEILKLREELHTMQNDLNASIRREQTEWEKNDKLLARVKELEKIGENILYQDNRSTSYPLFCVFQKEEMVVDEDFYYDKIIWCTDEGEEANPTRSKRLNILDENYRDTGKWNKRAIKMVDSFVTACFTEEGCKKYLSINGQNLKQPFIYAVSGYRNQEYQSVRDFLSSISSKGDK